MTRISAIAAGARRPRLLVAALRRRVRMALVSLVRQFETTMEVRSPALASVLEFYPNPRDQAELADLSARVNWYLPAEARKVPVSLGAVPPPAMSVQPSDAAYMERGLVSNVQWSDSRASGATHLVVHRLTPRSFLRYVANARRSTLVDPAAAYGLEEGFFRLAKRYAPAELPSRQAAIARLLDLSVPDGSAFVLATGPSAAEIDPADVRITCNSAVRNHELIRTLQPHVIAFGDPVFHYGPSRYAAEFRRDLLLALDECDAMCVTSQLFVEPLLVAVPEIRDRLVILDLEPMSRWTWPSRESASVRITGNVLTNMMLPVAFALAQRVMVAGCDGRQKTETYFWQHNRQTQYGDELMQTVFDAHPGFFRERGYEDYYDQHCAELAEFLGLAESQGRSIVSVTKSFIPALVERTGEPIWRQDHARPGGGSD